MHDILLSQLCANHSANMASVSDQTSASVILDMPGKPAIKVGDSGTQGKNQGPPLFLPGVKMLSSRAQPLSYDYYSTCLSCHLLKDTNIIMAHLLKSISWRAN